MAKIFKTELEKKMYSKWQGMKRRCDWKGGNYYRYYGLKGIKVCAEWRYDFDKFYDDMADSFASGLWLDRIDSTKNYSKANCRWATPRQQQENRSNNLLVEFNGKSQTLTRWAEELGIKRSTLAMRYYNYKWDINRCLITPTRKRG